MIENTFMVRNITINSEHNFFGLEKDDFGPTKSMSHIVSLDLHPYYVDNNSLDKLLTSVHDGKLVIVDTPECFEWVTEFKDEFREFMLERYPEKVLKNSHLFTKVVGKK